METEMDNIKNSDKKIKRLRQIVYVLLLLFVVVAIYVGWLMRQQKQTYTQNIRIKDELEQMMEEYELVKQDNLQFQSQLSEKDSIILAHSSEIKKLINSQADYRKIQRKLELLRGITQDYIHRIDSLIIVNEELSVENFEIKKEISLEREKNRELTKEKTELGEKVTQASTLKAYNIKAFAARVRGSSETETEKRVRADRFNVEFTLSENKIIPAGMRTIYVRIARPDGQIISLSEGDEYSFEMNGTRLQYTLKKEIVYNNTEQRIRLSLPIDNARKSEMAGAYSVSVFADTQEIGRTSFVLK